METTRIAAEDFQASLQNKSFGTILADPPWQFANRTGKVAPEYKRRARYITLSLEDIANIPVSSVADENSHLYLWVPNALLKEGLFVMERWGFNYKTNIIWHKVRKDGQPDGSGVGFYFRNTTEMVLFGVKGKLRTNESGRRQVNIIRTEKREHSRKPNELYELIESCSPGPYLEMFARTTKLNWCAWGNETDKYELEDYTEPSKSSKVANPSGKIVEQQLFEDILRSLDSQSEE